MELRRDALNIAGSLIGLLLVGILGFLAWALVFRAVPSDNETAMNVLLGILSQQVGLVVGFYFGSSLGAKRQTETIDKLAETAKAAQAALPPVDGVKPDIVVPPGDSVTVKADDTSTPQA